MACGRPISVHPTLVGGCGGSATRVAPGGPATDGSPPRSTRSRGSPSAASAPSNSCAYRLTPAAGEVRARPSKPTLRRPLIWGRAGVGQVPGNAPAVNPGRVADPGQPVANARRVAVVVEGDDQEEQVHPSRVDAAVQDHHREHGGAQVAEMAVGNGVLEGLGRDLQDEVARRLPTHQRARPRAVAEPGVLEFEPDAPGKSSARSQRCAFSLRCQALEVCVVERRLRVQCLLRLHLRTAGVFLLRYWLGRHRDEGPAPPNPGASNGGSSFVRPSWSQCACRSSKVTLKSLAHAESRRRKITWLAKGMK